MLREFIGRPWNETPRGPEVGENVFFFKEPTSSTLLLKPFIASEPSMSVLTSQTLAACGPRTKTTLWSTRVLHGMGVAIVSGPRDFVIV